MDTQPDRTFGRWLRATRRTLDLTQVELARRVYCAEITIRKIEADHLRPSRRLAHMILHELEIPLAEQDELVQLARRIARKNNKFVELE